MLDRERGLAGDNWLARGSKSTPDGSADPDRQVTVMNARVAKLVAGGMDRMPLAGDQLYVDLDLSIDNLPAGTPPAGWPALFPGHPPPPPPASQIPPPRPWGVRNSWSVPALRGCVLSIPGRAGSYGWAG